MKVAIDQEGFVVAIGSVDFDSNVEVMDIEVPEQIVEAFIKGAIVRYVNQQFQILTEEEFLQYLMSKPKERRQNES
ncbi:MAG: hypothetical protein QXX12_00640 [Nanopusillaceae archaeon]